MEDNRKIYARVTEVRVIEDSLAQAFIEANHRSKSLKSEHKTVNLGLFTAERLVAVAQFGSPRTAAMRRKYTSELFRMAFLQNTRVIGGASKLIKYYINELNPSDLFTYQDSTGELTDVYEHAGMTLVSEGGVKEYMVAPTKTLETATRKEALGMAYVTRYGPDRILGTKLGEVFDTTGARKSNKQIFLEELGWHVETTTGDRIYEWVHPDRTFYTYRITATDSDKYYYGVSHVKKANATVDDCIHDGYWGTGKPNSNNKFFNWKKKHKETLKKEILKRFKRKAEAYAHEFTLVGELYRTDKLCLNSTAGGKDGGLNFAKSRLAIQDLECPIHGKVKHSGLGCLTCNAEKRFSVKECSIHGLVTHTGPHCAPCLSAKTYADEVCAIHGMSLHKSGRCVKCSNEASVTDKLCAIHGETRHIGSQCYKCISIDSKVYTKQICPIHGEATFRRGSCAKCSARSVFAEELCATHGLTTHRSGVCQKCKNAESVAMLECERHGVTKHQGKTCGMCSGEKVRHARSHKTTSVPDCRFCEAS